jgi:hypothetical protein
MRWRHRRLQHLIDYTALHTIAAAAAMLCCVHGTTAIAAKVCWLLLPSGYPYQQVLPYAVGPQPLDTRQEQLQPVQEGVVLHIEPEPAHRHMTARGYSLSRRKHGSCLICRINKFSKGAQGVSMHCVWRVLAAASTVLLCEPPAWTLLHAAVLLEGLLTSYGCPCMPLLQLRSTLDVPGRN